MTGSWLARLALAMGLTAIASPISAQPATDATAAAAAVAQSDAQAPPARLTYANRTIALFRGTLMGRPPADRVATARIVLDQVVESGPTQPIEARPVGELTAIYVGGHYVFALLPTDLDPLAADTMSDVSARVVSQLQTTLDEVAELNRPRQLLFAAVQVVLATAVFIALIWGLLRAHGAASRRVSREAEHRLSASKVGDLEFLRSSRIVEFVNRLVAGVALVLFAFVAYTWLTFSLRRFPYTRPWGESLRAFLIDRLSLAASAILASLPGLFMVVVIMLLARFATRTIALLFRGVEDGRITLPGVYPETALPTRKLVSFAVWAFAVAVAFPYLPGSESAAFQGVSVFVGLMVSLGSSGLVNQVMSGLTLTYSRALRNGDFVRVGDIEGTVWQLGSLSTKIKTLRGEDITIPNAVVVSQMVTNYSRFADTTGVFVATEITLGYDTPWRQVRALLLLAAERTPGVRRTPEPQVRQIAHEDPYIKYALLFCPEHPAERPMTLTAVRENILDAFNEYGVQITSPNYEADPNDRKIVPKDQWFAAPAAPPDGPTGEQA